MQTRRTFVRLAAALASPCLYASAYSQAGLKNFDELLKSSLADQASLIGGNDREGRRVEFETRAIAPRLKPSNTTVSEAAIKLITLFEVSDKSVYDSKYFKPTLPAVSSGITIGIGYDLGYVKPEWLREDWRAYIDSETIKKLEGACKLTGAQAAAQMNSVSGINIPWTTAEKQFRENLLPRYIAETENALPNISMLSKDSLGALVSLVYNRGAAFRSEDPRREQMRNIRRHMERERFREIPAELVAMKQLWANQPNARGLLIRRDMEAALFQRGLSASQR